MESLRLHCTKVLANSDITNSGEIIAGFRGTIAEMKQITNEMTRQVWAESEGVQISSNDLLCRCRR